MLWQLKRISTGEPLNEPQVLPENWNGIFGLAGFQDRLNDLTWIGLEDQGWFEVEGTLPIEDVNSTVVDPAKVAWDRALLLLQESDWAMMSDVKHTKQKKIEWIEYRDRLRNIRSQEGFPDTIAWPTKP